MQKHLLLSGLRASLLRCGLESLLKPVNSILITSVFRYHPPIGSIWLKYWWNGRRTNVIHASIHIFTRAAVAQRAKDCSAKPVLWVRTSLHSVFFYTVTSIPVFKPCLSQSSFQLPNMTQTSYCSNARQAQPDPIRWLGPLRSDSVIKLVSVLFGKCTILVVTKCWPMETRLPCGGDSWKAEKLGAFGADQ